MNECPGCQLPGSLLCAVTAPIPAGSAGTVAALGRCHCPRRLLVVSSWLSWWYLVLFWLCTPCIPQDRWESYSSSPFLHLQAAQTI